MYTALWVVIGAVGAPHGIRGEVRVKPLTDFPERLERTERVYAAKNGGRRELAVETARAHGRGMYVMKFRGVNSRDEAEALKGARLEVTKDETAPLPPGMHYVFELIGLSVYDLDGQKLGVVTDVMTTAGNDVYAVSDENGNEILIPAVRAVVKSVDTVRGAMIVDPPPGLIDIYRR